MLQIILQNSVEKVQNCFGEKNFCWEIKVFGRERPFRGYNTLSCKSYSPQHCNREENRCGELTKQMCRQLIFTFEFELAHFWQLTKKKTLTKKGSEATCTISMALRCRRQDALVLQSHFLRLNLHICDVEQTFVTWNKHVWHGTSRNWKVF